MCDLSRASVCVCAGLCRLTYYLTVQNECNKLLIARLLFCRSTTPIEIDRFYGSIDVRIRIIISVTNVFISHRQTDGQMKK